MKLLIKSFLLIISASFLSACSSLPENLSSTDENTITDYQQWLDADPAKPVSVRLGGVIANVTNLADKTRIEVVNLPISSSGKPDINKEPKGRFIAYVDGFVEPVTFAKGRLVTFLGSNAQAETDSVGEFEYTFPVMNSNGYHLWRIEERVIVNDVGSYQMYPCRSLYCRKINYGPREGRVIQEVR